MKNRKYFMIYRKRQKDDLPANPVEHPLMKALLTHKREG
jgi:hypothetical protein